VGDEERESLKEIESHDFAVNRGAEGGCSKKVPVGGMKWALCEGEILWNSGRIGQCEKYDIIHSSLRGPLNEGSLGVGVGVGVG